MKTGVIFSIIIAFLLISGCTQQNIRQTGLEFLDSSSKNVLEINPQDYALTKSEMPGFEQTYFAIRDKAELGSATLALGWKTGFSAGYSNSTHEFTQFISIYPRENISKVMDASGFEDEEIVVPGKKFGEWSEAITFVDDDGQPGMNLVFYKGEVLQTLYVSGNDISVLEWYAQKAAAKVK